MGEDRCQAWRTQARGTARWLYTSPRRLAVAFSVPTERQWPAKTVPRLKPPQMLLPRSPSYHTAEDWPSCSRRSDWRCAPLRASLCKVPLLGFRTWLAWQVHDAGLMNAFLKGSGWVALASVTRCLAAMGRAGRGPGWQDWLDVAHLPRAAACSGPDVQRRAHHAYIHTHQPLHQRASRGSLTCQYAVDSGSATPPIARSGWRGRGGGLPPGRAMRENTRSCMTWERDTQTPSP